MPQNLILIKLQAFIRKETLAQLFSCGKFLRTPFLQNTSGGCFYKSYNLNHFKKTGGKSSSKWRVTVSGELMILDSYGNCDVTITVTLLL